MLAASSLVAVLALAAAADEGDKGYVPLNSITLSTLMRKEANSASSSSASASREEPWWDNIQEEQRKRKRKKGSNGSYLRSVAARLADEYSVAGGSAVVAAERAELTMAAVLYAASAAQAQNRAPIDVLAQSFLHKLKKAKKTSAVSPKVAESDRWKVMLAMAKQALAEVLPTTTTEMTTEAGNEKVTKTTEPNFKIFNRRKEELDAGQRLRKRNGAIPGGN